MITQTRETILVVLAWLVFQSAMALAATALLVVLGPIKLTGFVLIMVIYAAAGFVLWTTAMRLYRRHLQPALVRRT